MNAKAKRLSTILITKVRFAPISASIGWYHYMTDSLHSKYKSDIKDHSVTMERSIPLNLDLTCMEVFSIIFNTHFHSSVPLPCFFSGNYLLEYLFPKLLSLKSFPQNIS